MIANNLKAEEELENFFLQRPDKILRRLSQCHLGEVQSIEFERGTLKITSKIDAGMRKNWDGSGCEFKRYGTYCQQVLTITKDQTNYQNNYGEE